MYLNEKVSLNIKYVSGYSILRDADGKVIVITEADTYTPDPTYVAPLFPSGIYDPYEGQVQSTVMLKVKQMQDIYLSFINYQSPLNGIPDTTGLEETAPVFKEDAVTIIRDLDGNSI